MPGTCVPIHSSRAKIDALNVREVRFFSGSSLFEFQAKPIEQQVGQLFAQSITFH